MAYNLTVSTIFKSGIKPMRRYNRNFFSCRERLMRWVAPLYQQDYKRDKRFSFSTTDVIILLKKDYIEKYLKEFLWKEDWIKFSVHGTGCGIDLDSKVNIYDISLVLFLLKFGHMKDTLKETMLSIINYKDYSYGKDMGAAGYLWLRYRDTIKSNSIIKVPTNIYLSGPSHYYYNYLNVIYRKEFQRYLVNECGISESTLSRFL